MDRWRGSFANDDQGDLPLGELGYLAGPAGLQSIDMDGGEGQCGESRIIFGTGYTVSCKYFSLSCKHRRRRNCGNSGVHMQLRDPLLATVEQINNPTAKSNERAMGGHDSGQRCGGGQRPEPRQSPCDSVSLGRPWGCILPELAPYRPRYCGDC